MFSTAIPSIWNYFGFCETEYLSRVKKSNARFSYAHINANNECTGVWVFDEPIESSDLIAVDSADMSLIGKSWLCGVWVKPKASESH